MSEPHASNETSAPIVPMWLPTPGGRVFAWFHTPSGAPRRHAVLFCDPFGSDRMTLHLVHRYLAIDLAQRGFAVMRFDYPGTGDSEGEARTMASIERWLQSIHAAADHLKAMSGATTLGFFGARLGASLATIAAASRDDVQALGMLAPCLSGRAFVREAKAFTNLQGANPNRRRPADWQSGDQEAYGFLLPAAMIDELKTVSLTDIPCPVPHVCILTRDSGTPERSLVDRWRPSVNKLVFDEEPYIDINEITGVQGPVSPPFLERLGNWWASTFPERDERQPAQPGRFGPKSLTIASSDNPDEHIEERTVYMGQDGGIFGILTQPAPSSTASGIFRSTPCVLLVNGGNNHRVGINRNYTEWARAWAFRGYTVFRFDIRGLGDSPPLVLAHLNVLYREETRQDIIDAMNHLEQEIGCDHFALVGLCAGAYQSLQAALHDSRVSNVVLLDPLRFHGDPNGDAAAKLSDPRRWQRLLRGEVNLRKALSAAARVLADVPARLRSQPVSETAKTILTLTGRGCSVHLLFNEGAWNLDAFQTAIRSDLARVEASGRFSLDTIADSDHIFSPLWSQAHVGELVWAYLERGARVHEAGVLGR